MNALDIPKGIRSPAGIKWSEGGKDFYNITINEEIVGWLQARPRYCDRGHWQLNINVPGVDSADCFPRYYMDLSNGIEEAESFLRWRLWRVPRLPIPSDLINMRLAGCQCAVPLSGKKGRLKVGRCRLCGTEAL